MGDSAEYPTPPGVSFLLPTYNRREVVLRTLERINLCGPDAGGFEILLVDNASTDGTSEAVRERFPHVTVLRQTTNRGPCAKNEALTIARGEFIVFLDDDSYPEPSSVARMIRHFETDPGLGAAVFTVTLPDGTRECSAYPDVCIGCGTGFRREALREVGGLPTDFFMAAEEYDLSLRLLDAGWRVRLFDDLHVTHLKSPASRFPRRIARLDARNNTLLAMRYFPSSWRMRYALDWLERYRLMAVANGCRRAFWLGAVAGFARGMTLKHRPISDEAFEQFARIDQTFRGLEAAKKRMGLRRVLFVDLGKNMPAYRHAARRCGLEVVAIADERLGGKGLSFRGLPILRDQEARTVDFDAAIISNLSPVHAAMRHRAWSQSASIPVIDLFAPEATPRRRAAVA